MTEAREGINAFAKELYARCLYDPLEMLFKINLAQEIENMHFKSRSMRAINLFAMKEYFQTYATLLCPDFKQTPIPPLEYNYCSCCPTDQVFLRNYSVYILSEIKGTKEAGVKLGSVFYPDSVIEKTLALSGECPPVCKARLRDPFLLYLLMITKKAHLSPERYKKTLLYLLKRVPYFWDIYKLLAETVTISNCEEVLKSIVDPGMERLFLLYIGCKKSILHPDLKRLLAEYSENRSAFSAYEESLLAAVLGHYKKTTQALEAIERVVDESVGWCNFDQFSNILYSLKDTERLASLLFRVFDRFGNLPVYHYVSGNLLALKGDHVGSIEEFQQILHDECLGEFDIAYIFVAQEYFHLKDTCSAIKACNLALKKNYNDYRVWLCMAQIYFSIEMHEYALHFYRKCAELSPSTCIVYEGLGQCFDKLGRVEEALRCYRKCVDQGSTQALCLLGDLFFRQGSGEFKTYYEKYLAQALNEIDGVSEASIKTAERVIDALEETAGSNAVLQWREGLALLKHHLGT
ncbi:anaphase-promoting complex subunit 8 [Nematocida ausubeli]|nr:anaphase-promoting complex subunit 8 [Nematocida ausubeli]KAI5135512.1 anaphase-promoting complex subunit 8 [Nematocida ausubeli]